MVRKWKRASLGKTCYAVGCIGLCKCDFCLSSFSKLCIARFEQLLLSCIGCLHQRAYVRRVEYFTGNRALVLRVLLSDELAAEGGSPRADPAARVHGAEGYADGVTMQDNLSSSMFTNATQIKIAHSNNCHSIKAG